MLVFHSAYTFDDLKKRGLEIFVTARDAGHYFDSVLTVSPVASLQYLPESDEQNSPPVFFTLDDRNRLLEGRVGRFSFLARFPILNFAIAQCSVIYSLVRFGALREIKLVRAEDPRFNGLYGYIFSRLLRKPLVVGVWGNPERLRASSKGPLTPKLFSSSKIEARVERFVLSRANMVLAQNEENMSYVLSLGVRKERTSILPLGIGIDSCHFVETKDRVDVREDLKALGISADHLVLCISRLEKHKLVDYAVRACAVLEDSKTDFALLLIGDGRDRALLSDLAVELGIKNRVFFAGNRSQEWISRVLISADLAIAPLTGRALLEIALAGCPVAAFDVDWHNEIVKNGLTGELVENLNSKELGEAVLRILKNEELRQRYGRNIKTLALEMADSKRLALRQADIYRSLIEQS